MYIKGTASCFGRHPALVAFPIKFHTWRTAVNKLIVSVKGEVGGYPSLGVDESYSLVHTAGEGNIVLEAETSFGAIRGLETFSQLLQMNRGFVIRGGEGLVVVDEPKYPWRGLMLDPARHFITVAEVQKQIDAMAQNKLNVLHMHFTDGESFTIDTHSWPKFSNISEFGAYHPSLTYSKSDLKDIVEYARLRGVRVIPEFDHPAHMASWSLSHPSLIADCPTVNPHPEWPRYYSPADVTNPLVYDVFDTLLSEIGGIFPDPYFHVGGDEPHYDCWAADEKIVAWAKSQGYNTDTDLYNYYQQGLGEVLKRYNKTTHGWAEIFSVDGAQVPEDTVVEVWQGNDQIVDTISAGYKTIVSSDWYLDLGGDWTKFYASDPASYLGEGGDPEGLLLGGESCMWNAAFDARTNMDSQIWPNAAAAAEVLWTGKTEDEDKARTRLSQHRCRMVRRGVRVGPIAEDYCGDDIYVRKSLTYYYTGDFPISDDTPPP
ncbi:hypothetical protein TrLO_g9142 [Triparma laevis f. longispina]|uniref:Beta-hexosaminidase n=1 Tax=Triparma laevis f. longispina TaxID=1714387 RepID=A0A9W7A2N4_9STRA|nr:hypothetical protein TrLO_g9142 [Triparma laevis f. longispina]